ncbi:FecR family protein [Pedobacter africanus]|uniref:FecR family protein n=1 Tax=Pedobacter africanus TaxID=151894 RepID=A0A1W2CLL7_9SPHI|nr:FecR domain-containing protein [Pedobacter africanus]SMC86147.1 FecR family protein [Pedobacter africanus]
MKKRPNTEEQIRRYYDELQQDDQILDITSAEFDQDALYSDISSGIERAEKKKRFFKRFRKGAVAAVLFGGISIFAYLQLDKDALVEPVKMATAMAENGKVVNLVLADGTTIWLNSGSTLTYPSKFTGNTRTVSLTGEAYFEVAHRKTQPFLIRTGQLTTTVLGTTFNVNAYKKQENISVSVLSGKVGVADAGAKPVFLTPNLQVVYNRSGRSMKVKTVDASTLIAWREGKLIFKGTALTEVLAAIERKYDVSIAVNAAFKDCRISVDFNNESINKVMVVLSQVLNAQVVRTSGGYLLKGNGCK